SGKILGKILRASKPLALRRLPPPGGGFCHLPRQVAKSFRQPRPTRDNHGQRGLTWDDLYHPPAGGADWCRPPTVRSPRSCLFTAGGTPYNDRSNSRRFPAFQPRKDYAVLAGLINLILLILGLFLILLVLIQRGKGGGLAGAFGGVGGSSPFG